MSGTEKIILTFLMAILIVSSSPVSSARPAVAIVFDDGWTSQIYKAFPILQANNQTGTVFVITGEVPGATGQSDEIEYMNLSQLNKLYAAGWDLSSHTVTHPYLTTLNASALNTELNASKAYLDNAGFTRGSMFLAYPYGDFNSTVISAVQSNGYVAARTVCGSDPSNMCYFDLTAYPRYNATSSDRYEMVTLMAYGTNSSYSMKRPPAYVINEINNTINSNGFLIITFHFIVDAAATIPEEYNTSDFKAISDYLKSRSADIDVVTLSQFFNGATPTPIPTPPPDTIPPTITITTPAATNYTEGSLVLASFTCSDAQSGVKSCTGTVPNGMAINTTGLGMKTFTVNASDNAGNNNSTTVQYTVVPVPPSGSVKIIADKNTWVAQASPTTNYGSDTELVINNVTNAEEAALIHYNLSGQVPAGVTITGATQYMYLRFISANTLKVNRLTADFVQETTNWNNKPTVGELVTSYLINPSSVGWKQINITAAVKNWYSGAWSNNGLYINSTIDDEVDFAQIGDTNQPYIIVNYTSNSPPPQTYMPPTPTISAIIGLDYILTTWTDGAGNKTDKFNVFLNGVWNNGTTNHSVNQTGMAPGQSSNVSVYAINGTTMNQTPATLVSSIPAPNPPAITGSAPASPVNDVVGVARAFNITLNQTANVTWYINGSQVSSDSNVLVANYTNISAAIGTWNVSAVASNNNGSAIQTWIWKVTTSVPSVPIISFTDPTPANGATLTQNYAYVNTTTSATSTALIDWNRTLAGWWRFSNESGENSTFFRDWSSWGNNGTCSGTACPNSTSGKFGKALSFDGINDYVTMGNPSNGALNFGTGDFSISSWFYMSSLPNAWKTIASKGDSGAVGYGMEISSGNQLTCSIQAIGGTNQHVGSAAPSIGSWHQAVCVFARNDKIYVYLDGIRVTSGAYAVNNTNSITNPYQFGVGSRWGSIWFFNGSIDEVQLFSRALSPEEINASFNAGSNRLYHNFTNLANGNYSYKAYTQDLAGNVNQTETRTLTLTSPQAPGSPSITGFAPSSPVTDTPGATREFSITINQTVNVTWYINGSQVSSNSSVLVANYTNISAAIGTWNVSAVASNNNGSAIQTWVWIVTASVPSYPVISFTDPTPANGAILTQNYANVNTTALATSTAFIDWNRSLVGWWRFSNESGENSAFFRDWSSWGNNGTCSGTSCPNSTSGKFGNALSFDGINDYVTMGNPSNGALNFGTGDFSISSWFYMSSLPNAWETIASKGDSGAVGYGMEISSGNQLTCSIQAVGGTNQHLVGSVPSVGSWHQGVCVFARNDKIYVYLDGIKVTSGTYAANNTNSVTNPYQFGIGSHNGNVWFFNGSIDEVQLFSRALSPEEINASFNASSNRLYHNFTNLGSGTYSYKAYAQDLAGNVNQTEIRTLNISV